MSKKRSTTDTDNDFSLSIGDLMAALLFIFVLLLAGTMYQLQENEKEISKENIIIKEPLLEYKNTQQYISKELMQEFKQLLAEEAEIKDLTIKFRSQQDQIMFDNDKAEIKPHMKEVLNDFFPKYIKFILSDPRIKNAVQEISIDGHSSNDGTYFHNMEISQQRAKKILEYCCTTVGEEENEWMRTHVTANGYSYSRPIIVDGREDKDASRRVEFCIRTNAEKKIFEILNKLDSLNNMR